LRDVRGVVEVDLLPPFMTYYRIQTTWESFSDWMDKTFKPNDPRLGVWRQQGPPQARLEIFFAVTDEKLLETLQGWEVAELPKVSDNPDWVYVGNHWLFPGQID
jgi:hypothetical protein